MNYGNNGYKELLKIAQPIITYLILHLMTFIKCIFLLDVADFCMFYYDLKNIIKYSTRHRTPSIQWDFHQTRCRFCKLKCIDAWLILFACPYNFLKNMDSAFQNDSWSAPSGLAFFPQNRITSIICTHFDKIILLFSCQLHYHLFFQNHERHALQNRSGSRVR